ncbi:MAG: ADOP family duplicated permease [Candidatus Acidiferrales bacterium]
MRAARHRESNSPRLARWLLRLGLRGAAREAVMGDLEEEFHRHLLPEIGPRAARRWYWEQALRSLAARLGIMRASAGHQPAAANSAEALRPPAQKGDSIMHGFWQDLRHGARTLIKNPGFTAIAALILALGIGANTAIFSVIYGVLLHPLPYAEAERVVAVFQTDARKPGEQLLVSPGNFLDWRERAAKALEHLAAVSPWAVEYQGGDEPQSFDAVLVSEGYFAALGVEPVLGRTFQPEDHKSGAGRVLMLTHGLWQQKFGGDPSLVGGTLVFSGEAYTVAGILPPEFRSPVYPGRGIYAPLIFWPGAEQLRSATYLGVVGRLRPGVALREAEAALGVVNAQIAAEHPRAAAALGAQLIPAREQIIGGVRASLWTLFGAAALILLVACSNVAQLQLVRASRRSREFAIRLALGAGRGRLLRQLLAEGVSLIAVASLLGLFFAYWGVELLRAFAPGNIPRLSAVQVNTQVLAFGAMTASATLILFVLAPTLQLWRANLQPALKEGSGGASAGERAHGVRNFLIVSEVGLAVVLLVGAGLLTRSFVSLLRVDPGFQSENALSMQVFVYNRYATPEKQVTYFREALARLRETPGVAAAGAVSAQPFLFGTPGSVPVSADDSAAAPGQEPVALVNIAAGDYFLAAGIPLLRGRSFTDHDHADSSRVAVISESMARRFWPGADAIGKTFTVQQTPPQQLEVIGVVGDVRNEALDEPLQPQFYRAHAQSPSGGMSFVVKTTSDASALLPAVKQAIWSVNAQQPFYRISAVEDLVSRSLAQRRFVLYLLGGFSALALVLAALGLYGVISFLTAQRTREIGVRVALGAQRPEILRMVLRQGMRLAGAGVALGIAAALAATRLLGGMLYAVTANDPLTYAGIALLLLGVALLACWAPARRASKVDPVVALRYE